MSQAPNTSDFQIRSFVAQDFLEYQRWFESKSVNKFLGEAPDQSWLEHVLNDKSGVQLSILMQQKLVAVAGICFATQEHPTQVITDFAVNPDMSRMGIGSRSLKLVLSQFKLDEGIKWQTFVEHDNFVAQRFFQKNGWRQVAEADDAGMLTFQLPNQ